MPQNQTLTDPLEWLKQQSEPAKPQGQQFGPFLPPPGTPGLTEVQKRGDAAVAAMDKLQPHSRVPLGSAERPVQSAVRGAVLGGMEGLGIPLTQHPVRDFGAGLLNTLTAPPEAGTWEERVAKAAPQLGPAAIPAVRMGKGVLDAAVNAVTGSIPEAYRGTKNYIQSGDPQQLERATHGGAQAAAVLAPLAELSKPPVVRLAAAADDAARSVVRHGVGAGEKAVARAEGAAAGEAADVAAKNAKAAAEHTADQAAKMREARDAAAQEHVAQLEKQTANDVNWEQGTREKVTQYMHDVAENEKAHADLTKQITEENAANKTAVERRAQIDQELTQHRSDLQNRLRQTADKAEADAKAMYPEIEGEGNAADIGAQVHAAATEKLKGSGPMPGPIQRIIADYTPIESEGGGVMEGDTLHGPGDPIYEDLKAKGQLRPEEEVGAPGQTPEKATVEMLHGQYSELGRAFYDAQRTGAPGDVVAAIAASRDVVGAALRDLYKQAGRLPEFNAAQQNYAKVMTRFYDRTSPIARMLNDTTQQAGFDPARAQTGAVARTSAAERVLKNPENVKILQRYLKDYEGAPLDVLDQILKMSGERDTLPKKFTAKQIPVKKSVAVPDVPLREQLAQPTETRIPRGGLTPPPEAKPVPGPLDRKAFIKGKIQQMAESFMKVSPWETGAAVSAGSGLFLHGEPAAAAGALSYPVLRYALGKGMESPRFQEWAARERVTPPPQLGMPGAQGAATPFEAPPNIPGGVERRATPRPGGAPTPQNELVLRQTVLMMPSEAMMTGYLDRLGIKVDPTRLMAEKNGSTLYGELSNILEDLGQKPIDAKKLRSIKDVLEMKNLDPFEAGTRIRERLGLKTGQ